MCPNAKSGALSFENTAISRTEFHPVREARACVAKQSGGPLLDENPLAIMRLEDDKRRLSGSEGAESSPGNQC